MREQAVAMTGIGAIPGYGWGTRVSVGGFVEREATCHPAMAGSG